MTNLFGESQLHAHVSTVSADCDGQYYNAHVVTFNDDERAESGLIYNDFSEIHFMERVLNNVASPYAVRQLKLTMDEEGIDGNEDTEEGYRSFRVEWCRSESCDTDETERHDYRAEAMGY
jgi:hypothetical protein